MGGTDLYFLSLSVGFALSVVAFVAVLFSNKTTSTHFYMGESKGLDPKVIKAVNMFGGDLLSLIPKNIQKRSMASKELNDIFKESGNPWNVTKMEFLALRAAYGFIYVIIGILFSLIIQPGIISVAIVAALGLLGWNKPLSYYKSVAKKREKDFKKHFPEMLDYLTMIMSDGNYTFANAIETVVPYLPESAVKEEFTKVTDSINAGVNTETALNELAERLPSPSLEAFVRAVNNANQLNTPMNDLMRTRAENSREDLMNEIEMIIQTLPTKTMLTIGPATIGSMLAIFLIPVIIALLDTL